MSGAPGLFGKLPAHGDFVRRNLPRDFVAAWDAWLSEGILALEGALVPSAWRFHLPAGACGSEPVAGVVMPSEDMVGRCFPITLAATLPPGSFAPAEDWYEALEAVPLDGPADAVLSLLPPPMEGAGELIGLWRPGVAPMPFTAGYAALATAEDQAPCPNP